MTNDDISCFLVFSVISRKKAAAFGFPIAAAKGNILEYLTEEKFCSIIKIKAYTILERKDT